MLLGLLLNDDDGDLPFRPLDPTLSIAIVIVIGTMITLRTCKESRKGSDYAPWLSSPSPPKPIHKVDMSSHYLTMSDGIRLAADIHLPADWKVTPSKEKLPVILHITRYGRSMKVRFPFSLFLPYFNTRSGKYVTKMVTTRRYGFVSVDARGTGASFGTRPIDLHPREIQDFQEVVHWVLQQPWCNGKIGTGGISYDGMTGVRLAGFDTTGSVKAAALMFAPDDLYTDLVMPGGLFAKGFMDSYASFTGAQERNIAVTDVPIPFWIKFLSQWVTDGVLPVNNDVELLKEALQDHQDNWDMVKTCRRIQFKDEPIVAYKDSHTGQVQVLTSMDFCVHNDVVDGLVKNNVKIHQYASYYDSGSIRGVTRLHQQLEGKGMDTGMTIGPWTHGGRQNCSPYSSSTQPCFDILEDVAQFWDRHLQSNNETCNEMQKEQVRLFTLGEERFRVLPSWPMKGRHCFMYRFGSTANMVQVGRKIAFDTVPSIVKRATSNSIYDEYIVDDSVGTGFASRWNLVQHVLMQPTKYNDRKKQDERLLTYTSDPMDKDIVITGSPLVTLSLSIQDGSDAAVFVYLEIVESNGHVVYLTEGQLRAGHGTSDSKVELFDGISTRTYMKQDYSSIAVGSIIGINVPLEPISVRIFQGMRLRIAVAGSDVDNFDTSLPYLSDLATNWRVYHGTFTKGVIFGSALLLPIEA